MIVNKTTCVLLLSACVLAANTVVVDAAPPAWVVTTNFPAIKDTCIIKFDPNTVFGASNTMIYKAGWYVTNAGGTQDLRYPSVDFGNVISSLPAGSQVYGARMTLTCAAGNMTVSQRIFQRTTNWDESTASWNSGPPAMIEYYNNHPAWQASQTTVLYDVTYYIDKGMRGGNVSACFGLSGGGEDNGSSADFHTREAATPANRPVLTVDYVPVENKAAVLRYGLNSYTGVVDTYITPRYPTNDYGSAGSGFVENPWGGYVSRTLIKFDLNNALPDGAKFKQAILAFTVGNCQVSSYVNVTATECLRPWTPQANYSNYTAVAQWQTPDGLGALDQAASPVATTNTSATDQGMIYLDVTASVDKWMRGFDANNGWFIDGGVNQIVYFYLSEANASARPTLWLQYELRRGTVVLVR